MSLLISSYNLGWHERCFYLLFHLLTALAKLIRPSGGRAVIAENLHLKQQLIIHSRVEATWLPLQIFVTKFRLWLETIVHG